MKRKNHISKAFTLAEVLITLGIIGVVATLTIPTLMNNIGIAQYRSALKKEYSVLSQAISALAQDSAVDTSSADNFISALSTQIKMQKIGTWGSITTLPANFNYKCYKNTSGACGNNGNGAGLMRRPNSDGCKSFITSDGVLFCIPMVAQNCDADNWNVKIDSTEVLPINNRCAVFWVDLNGDKSPNQFGMDMHQFFLVKQNDNYYMRPTGANNSTSCSANYPEDYNHSINCTNRMLLDMPMP